MAYEDMGAIIALQVVAFKSDGSAQEPRPQTICSNRSIFCDAILIYFND